MHFNIPIFIPHLGCPFQCIYCNQKYISGIKNPPDLAEVHAIIRQKLSTINGQGARVEVAFFGGSFTCLSLEEQRNYLEAVQPYIAENKINGIRISTRPDFIDDEKLQMLKKFQVQTIELGVQSMNDSTLKKIHRGHNAADVRNAANMIKKHGIALGIQTMVGLPGEDSAMELNTAREVIAMQPDCMRIYPLLVLQDTNLEQWHARGKYMPLALPEAVERVAAILEMYIANDINVIKVGLHPSDEYAPGGKLVAGPFHPSFREMAMTIVWKRNFVQHLLPGQKAGSQQDIIIMVADSQYNYAIGYKSENKDYLKQYFNRVRFRRSTDMQKLQFDVDYC
ncbi:MAG TPA: radical SAM protein [Bacteroidales bacterium]|nr:radical SAM protein [Bacteroidales bacterium]HQI69824.1 radical SAM protein [Bacteroidales bacterium]